MASCLQCGPTGFDTLSLSPETSMQVWKSLNKVRSYLHTCFRAVTKDIEPRWPILFLEEATAASLIITFKFFSRHLLPRQMAHSSLWRLTAQV